MSDVFQGFARVEKRPAPGMITLRGDLGALAGVVQALTDLPLPGVREVVQNAQCRVAWMSPDELLVMLPHARVAEALARIEQDLQGVPHLAADVSDMRALFGLTGPVRDVLAKLTPSDLRPEHFAPGQLRRTRLGQVPAAIWLEGPDAAQILCFRSVAPYVWDLLTTVARAGTAPDLYAIRG